MAVIVGFFGFGAQYRRANRRGVEGVSLATWTLFVLMGFFWIVYGIVARSWEISLGSVIVLPLQLSVVFRLKPWQELTVVARCVGFFVACCVLPTLAWGWSGGVYGTGVAMAINRWPQLIELVRHEDASGVSVWSWVLGVVGTGLWIAYYVGTRLWAALAATACALLANLVIALLANWRHGQARAALIRAEVFVAH